ncbi:MAG: HAMP domain-containing histidine kinase [Oscillospiraceae bacterium]|nr:HAMP domain-containing histidine kinase [Oscillospiraceae bacterium]
MSERVPAQLRLVRVNDQELMLGVCLIGLSFFMPVMFTVVNFGVLDSLRRALVGWDEVELMLAALQLITLNSLRTLMHYIGAFFIAESLEFRKGKRVFWEMNVLLVVVVLLVAYWGIDWLHGVHYDFGLPAVLVMGTVILIYKLDYQYIAMGKKVLFLATGCIAFQFLDLMPALGDLPVGRGEVSMDIKLASELMGSEKVLNVLTAAGFVLFLAFSLLFFSQLNVENSLRQLAELKEQNQAIRTEARINEMQNRTYREMQYLVHDLKSPLTVVQTLVGVIKMECEMEERAEDLEYLTRIEGAVEQMSRMISEILYEEQATPETVKNLVDRALSQISVEEYAKYVHAQVEDPAIMVKVNRVLLPRALVNLIKNSATAIPADRTPDIRLIVDRVEDGVRFRVQDNGMGISKDKQKSVWNRGYSDTRSSGLGLPFVRSVVERVGGRIELNSEKGEGTVIDLILPEEEMNYGS